MLLATNFTAVVGAVTAFATADLRLVLVFIGLNSIAGCGHGVERHTDGGVSSIGIFNP